MSEKETTKMETESIENLAPTETKPTEEAKKPVRRVSKPATPKTIAKKVPTTPVDQSKTEEIAIIDAIEKNEVTTDIDIVVPNELMTTEILIDAKIDKEKKKKEKKEKKSKKEKKKKKAKKKAKIKKAKANKKGKKLKKKK